MKPARPKSIAWFERLFVASIVLFTMRTVWNWVEALSRAPESAEWWASFNLNQLILLAFGLSMNLTLWYFIARRASNIAKWILIVITALGLMVLAWSLPALVQAGAAAIAISPIITHSLVVLSIAFLFRKDARLWFGNRSQFEEDPADLAERFR